MADIDKMREALEKYITIDTDDISKILDNISVPDIQIDSVVISEDYTELLFWLVSHPRELNPDDPSFRVKISDLVDVMENEDGTMKWEEL